MPHNSAVKGLASFTKAFAAVLDPLLSDLALSLNCFINSSVVAMENKLP